jgi:DNA repair protein RecN (Recombination protein N)
MLVSLFIKDFALISEQRIDFGQFLNIISGETGAGKSILLGALDLVLGGRATTDMIKTGSLRSLVEAEFKTPDGDKGKLLKSYIDHHGFGIEENLILKREIRVEGKGRAFLNGQQVPGSMLKEIGRYLIDIHGQNEHQNILSLNSHRQILDRFGSNSQHAKKLNALYKKLESLRQQLSSIELSEEDKKRNYDLLNHQIEELLAARLESDDELNELARKDQLFENAEQYANDLKQALFVLSEREPSIPSEINRIERILESHVSFDSQIEPIFHNLRDSYYALEEVARGLRNRLDSLNFDEEEVQIVRERLDLLQAITRKYGGSIGSAKECLEDFKNRKAGIELSEEQTGKLKKEIAALEEEQLTLARNLSDLRRTAATSLDRAVKQELSDLSMKHTQIKTSIKWQRKEENILNENSLSEYLIGPEGLDLVEFLLAANENENLRPLRKIASGGEMSRIMLSLKKVTIDTDPIETMIFDEVDAGVGGAIAESVGMKLKQLAERAQVIVITHLPQIASMGAENTVHFRVEKDKDKGSKIKKLNSTERVQEIGRMLGGSELTETAINHAKELLDRGQS